VPLFDQMFELIGKSSSKCLNVPLSSTSDGALMEILTCSGGSNQLFRANGTPDGRYVFTNVNSGKCLHTLETMPDPRLAQWTCDGSATQAFAVQNTAVGYFSLVNMASGFCPDVFGNVTTDTTYVHLWTCSGLDNQSWQFSPVYKGGCTPESDASFCARSGATCGAMNGVDNCGSARAVVNCGPCPSLMQACGISTANVCGAIGKVNVAQGGTVTASDPGASVQVMTNAFDGDAATKWLVVGAATPWIAYQFAGATSYVVTSYSVTSGDDWSDRDPKAWRFEGSNNGSTWTTLDTQMNEYFGNRLQTNYYTFTNGTAYNRYRLIVTANNSSHDFQLAEIQLFP